MFVLKRLMWHGYCFIIISAFQEKVQSTKKPSRVLYEAYVRFFKNYLSSPRCEFWSPWQLIVKVVILNFGKKLKVWWNFGLSNCIQLKLMQLKLNKNIFKSQIGKKSNFLSNQSQNVKQNTQFEIDKLSHCWCLQSFSKASKTHINYSRKIMFKARSNE